MHSRGTFTRGTASTRKVYLLLSVPISTAPTATAVAMSPAAIKRSFSGDPHDAQPPKRVLRYVFCGQLNAKTLRQLQEAFKANPEVDFTKVLPKNYSSCLASRLADKGKPLLSSLDGLLITDEV